MSSVRRKCCNKLTHQQDSNGILRAALHDSARAVNSGCSRSRSVGMYKGGSRGTRGFGVVCTAGTILASGNKHKGAQELREGKLAIDHRVCAMLNAKRELLPLVVTATRPKGGEHACEGQKRAGLPSYRVWGVLWGGRLEHNVNIAMGELRRLGVEVGWQREGHMFLCQHTGAKEQEVLLFHRTVLSMTLQSRSSL